jgi:hypothetical protein
MTIIQIAKREYSKQKNRLKDVITATVLALTAFVISLWVFKETLHGLFTNKIPLAGDGLLTGLYIKIVEQSSYSKLFLQDISSAQFGWPNKLDFTSYPVGNSQEMFGIKVFMDKNFETTPTVISDSITISWSSREERMTHESSAEYSAAVQLII